MLVSFTNTLGQPVGPPLPGWQPPPRPEKRTFDGVWCRLEPLNPERHAADLHGATLLDQDGTTWTYLPYGPFDDFAQYRAWLALQAVSIDPLFFAIVDLRTGRAAGVASYLRIDPTNGVIEVGHLCFPPGLKGTPAATEAMYLMMQHAFTLGYRRYEWKCDALNEPSRRAAQRLGFTFEGLFRQAVVVKGRNRDTAWHSIIDQEWARLQPAFEQWLAPSNFNPDGTQRCRLSDLTRATLQPQALDL